MSSHLDIEHPRFKDKPHIWVQWKGTDACIDVHCSCGVHGHLHGDFLYFIQCGGCKKVWELGTHIELYDCSKEQDGDIPIFRDED